MAKIVSTFAAIERYDLKRDPVDHRLDPVVPEKVDVVHACFLPEGGTPWMKIHHTIADATEPVFASSEFEGQKSACGRKTKVFLPRSFESEPPV
jgi:hypothetical protein